MKDPVSLIHEIWKKHRFLIRTFLITYSIGLVTHIYMFTNRFFNYFELGNILADMSFWQGDTIAQGRWFLPIATNLFTGFSMPLINGLISLLYISLSAVMIVDLLKLRSAAYAALFGGLLAAFPGYACVLAYGVNADAISMGVFMCALAIWLYEKYRFGFLPAILLIGCGLGAYQTFLSVSIAMVYAVLFFKAYNLHLKWKPFWISVIRSACMLAAGFVFYYLMLQISCRITGVSLTDYHGVDSMTSFTLKGIVKGFVYSYLYFFRYFFTLDYGYSVLLAVLNVMAALVLLILACKRLLQWKRERNMVSFWMLLAFLLFLPLGVNATPFLMADRVGAGVDRYMIFSIVVLWGILLKMMDEDRWEEGESYFAAENMIITPMKKKANGKEVALQWAGCVSMMAAFISSVIICNSAYHRMEAATVTQTALFQRIAFRLEEMEEWQQGMPVYFANAKQLLSQAYTQEIPQFEGILNMPGTEISPHYNERGIAKYFRVYLHMPIPDAGDGKKEQIQKSEAFQRMPAYPAEGSITVMEGVIVVKMTETEDATE